MKTIKPYIQVIGYLLSVHLICLLYLSICRLLFCAANLPAEGVDWSLLPMSLLIGVKFDNLIACYVSALPSIIVPVWALCSLHRSNYPQLMNRVIKAVVYYYAITYSILLFVHVANARYYHFFDNHLNIGVTEWFGFVGDTAGLLFGDKVNLIFLGIAIVIIALYIWSIAAVTRRFADRWQTSDKLGCRQYVWCSVLTILLWGAVFCGIRGSFQRYPLDTSFAYFCDDPFYNKLGINPVFNLEKSFEYNSVKIPAFITAVDEQEATAYVQHELAIKPIDPLRPLLREGSVHRCIEGTPNVVLVFMESMTADNLERKENGKWLTPFLRSLRDKSIYWSNCYSTGTHTNNGIVGVHYGFVPNFAKSIMNGNTNIYTGLPYFLKRNGYENICFITGNPQYDSMNSFWRDNHIHRIYSLYDYGPGAAVNNYGVSDSYLFDYGLRKLDEYSQQGKPFFASFLTISNHGPYVVPKAYEGRAENPEQQVIAYADDALRMFIESAQKTDWGQNTLFVLVADHGTNLPCPYEMVLSHNHIPVYIFGAGVEPEHVVQPASQTDIWPTVLSMLGIEYTNNCTGIDILNESRRYAFFVSDNHLGVSDGEYFWCYGLQTQRECLYRIGSGDNILPRKSERAADMRRFGLNMQRVNLMAIDKKWTAPLE